MFIIDLTITETVDEQSAAEHLAAHRAWFSAHVESGDFILLGPRLDREKAGIIVARAASREDLEKILSQDVYYPDGATYEVAEFKAASGVPEVAGLLE
ncbi:YciI family protein [Actinomyces sp. ZJ308]|uniref:YciI family protein n=1 Tax=Actinomyces sp. ZJ308 TaxID=2708342 RepID=UPI00141F87EA|nr:YciI family protein [Actinomyces sp. ZJ308]